MNVLDHLTQEHRKVEAMLGVLAESQPGDDREQTVTDLEDALATHMAVEEKFVYPIVSATMGDSKESEAENEHDETRSGLEQLRILIADDGFTDAVATLADGLNHHVQEEETEIFPTLKREAAAELAKLGDPEALEEQVETDDLGSRKTA